MSDRGVSDEELVRLLPGDFRNGSAEVNGTRLHYVASGQGRPLFLLPGWPQTWWVFRKIMPTPAGRYRVVAVDIRGVGGSAKPDGGYDKKTMAQDVRELARHLGYEQIDIHHRYPPARAQPSPAGGWRIRQPCPQPGWKMLIQGASLGSRPGRAQAVAIQPVISQPWRRSGSHDPGS
jgi:hypothetical protein